MALDEGHLMHSGNDVPIAGPGPGEALPPSAPAGREDGAPQHVARGGPARGGHGQLRLLIAEANALVRAGLHSIMAAEGLAVVGEAISSSGAIASAAALSPDVVLLDCSLGEDAMVALRGIRAASPGTAVVFFASSVDRQHVVAAVEGGASGYLLKDQAGADLVAGVRAAAAGGTPIAPNVVAVLIDGRTRRDDEQPTARELEVLELVADGFSNKQIARRLGISEGTVKSHLGSAFRRIGATRRTQAALWVHQRRTAHPEFPAAR